MQVREPEVKGPAQPRLAEAGHDVLVLQEQVPRLHGAAQHGEDVGEPVHDLEPPRHRGPRRAGGSLIASASWSRPHRLLERVAARRLVGEMDEIGQRAARLVGAREVMGEQIVVLVEPARVHRLERLADGGVQRLPARAEQRTDTPPGAAARG